MSDFLVLYSTTDGHTRHICERLVSMLRECGYSVTIADIAEHPDIEPGNFDKVVIGASIRYGRHSPMIRKYINKHYATLECKASALFSVNLVARKPEKSRPETNPYFRKFLRQIRWRPQHAAVFAGRLDYPAYSPFDRWMIRLIMWITQGPTDPKAVVEFTDWKQVEDFGRIIARM